MNLYGLSKQYQELMNLDMDPDLLADTVAGLTGEIQIKAEGLLHVTGNLDSDINQIDEAIKRLQARKKSLSGRKQWLHDYLRFNMQESEISKIDCPLWSITLKKAPKVVDVTDDSKLPPPYKMVIVTETTKIDKALIARDLKSGVEIPGAELKDGKQALLIR